MSEEPKPEPERAAENGTEEDKNTSFDPHYEPIVSLPLVEVNTNEDEEVELCNLRARLYRYDMVDHEWKERGTGNVKLLHHTENNTVRVVMRRDVTFKICANHFITADIEMAQHLNSERAFNWTTFGDYADEIPKREFLAIRFRNREIAETWKTKFDEAQEIVRTKCTLFDASDGRSADDSSSSELSDPSEDEETEKSDLSKEKILDDSNEKISDEVITKLTELAVENKENEPINAA